MSEDQVQISGYISASTKRRLDQFARETGLKKGYVLEAALDRFITAADEVPDEFLIPSEITLTADSFDEIAELLTTPREPNAALKRLLSDS